ncbi:hypothetical protein [uncultured Paludibaculum sp.]|uniref:hypothetical protein n=1 Tax=uncultured Paludibaculum sp. TaxID=1765020 RepID=UPI002AAB8402|nr:hypothetical protein [uncultured Paludibaculum sp.]
MELIMASRVKFAAAGLYAAPSPVFSVLGGGANVRCASTGHGLTTGNYVVVSGTTGVAGLNATWPVRVIDADTFELVGSSALTGTAAGSPAVALPDLDISALDKEWYVRVKVYGTGLVSLEDTVNAWTATERRFLFPARANDQGQEFIINWRDWEGGDRFGVASAKLRIRLVSGTNVMISAGVSTNG